MKINDYAKSKRIELGTQLKPKIKIYLDTKYWIDLCDFALGKTTKNNLEKIYTICHTLVENGSVIFPISQRIFSEIIKQSDQTSFEKTVQLIDKLSMGVTLISEEERIYEEIYRFIYQHIGQSNNIYEKEICIWTKMVYILGFSDPQNEYTTFEIQKSFFDYMWDIPLSKMMETMGFEKIQSFPKLEDISGTLNIDKITYATENKTIQQLYMNEVGGMIDFLKNDIHKIMVRLYEINTNSEYYGNKDQSDPNNLMANSIYNCFLYNKIGLFFPTIDINARLHTMIRWDRGRKYKPNDLHDIGHASSALPYFDYFFTERSLCSLITAEKYDQKYSCKVAWNDDDVLDLLNALLC
jgi:hypothetical protein